MKNRFRSLLLIILPVIALSSCVYDKELAYLNDQIIALNRRVTKLEDAQTSMDQKMSRDLDASLQSTRSAQADAVAASQDVVVGPTLADGGVPEVNVEQVLGQEAFETLVEDMFHPRI